jgi:radical SAM-linked protein
MEPPTDETTYVRIRFSKLDAARYLSHRNLMSVWERALRRAGVPVSFTGGYSPRPMIHFGPPVPVGYAARDELLDIRVDGLVDAGKLIRGLNQNLPAGIAVLDVEKLPGKPPSLMASARSAGYQVLLDDPDGDVDELVREFLGLPALEIEIRRGERSRQVDIRSAVLDLEWRPPAMIAMRLRAGEGASCRPEDVLAAISINAGSVTRTDIDYGFE